MNCILANENVPQEFHCDNQEMKKESSVPKTIPVAHDLENLIQQLHQVFSQDSINVEYVKTLMESYKSKPIDWKKFAKFDRCRYTRNLVDEGNGRFNLIVLCWGEGHGSAIHNHANSHCFMKMLSGSLNEIRFGWPDPKQPNEPLVETSRGLLKHDEVTYINDSQGLHRVENSNHSNTAVSLHLYSPPFQICKTFNEHSGKDTDTQITFWSKNGGKRDRIIQEKAMPEDN